MYTKYRVSLKLCTLLRILTIPSMNVLGNFIFFFLIRLSLYAHFYNISTNYREFSLQEIFRRPSVLVICLDSAGDSEHLMCVAFWRQWWRQPQHTVCSVACFSIHFWSWTVFNLDGLCHHSTQRTFMCFTNIHTEATTNIIVKITFMQTSHMFNKNTFTVLTLDPF